MDLQVVGRWTRREKRWLPAARPTTGPSLELCWEMRVSWSVKDHVFLSGLLGKWGDSPPFSFILI